MSHNPIPPERTPPIEGASHIPQDLGTRGVPGFPDTFYGPRDKKYLDFIARQSTRIRGVNAYYYVLQSQSRRLDGNAPVTDAPGLGPFDQRGRSGGNTEAAEEAEGLSALYGDPVVIGTRLSSVKREVTPSWDFHEPILVRGVATRLGRSENADPRGSIYIQQLQFDLARVLCTEEWNIYPQPGDVVRLPNFLVGYDPLQPDDCYYDVKGVENNSTGLGTTGYFSAYKLTLIWQSKYDPQRKMPDRIKTTEPDPIV